MRVWEFLTLIANISQLNNAFWVGRHPWALLWELCVQFTTWKQLNQMTHKGFHPMLCSSLLEAFSQPNSSLPRRNFLRSKRLQQHPKFFKPLLLQETCTELQQPFQGLCPLLVRWSVKPTLSWLRRWPAGCTSCWVMFRGFTAISRISMDPVWDTTPGKGSFHNLDCALVLRDWAVSNNVCWWRRAMCRCWWGFADGKERVFGRG